MEFTAVIERRRSVRKFLPEAVPATVIEKAIDHALLAPNTSNLQPWEFYWIKSAEKKARVVKAAMSQPAAATAGEIIAVVSRIDTWNRNRKLILGRLTELLSQGGAVKPLIQYYDKLVPFIYRQGPFGILNPLKWLIFNVAGLFRPVPRALTSRSGTFEVVTKTTALACENFMLSLVDQGYASCPMEGFDECRVKRILGLGRNTHVVMLIGVGRAAPDGVYGPRGRLERKLFVHSI